MFDQNVVIDILKCTSQTCLIPWVWKKGKGGVDAVQSRALSYLPAWPACSLRHQIKIWGDLGSSSLSSSTHQHPLAWGIVDRGEEKTGFSVSCLCWLLSAGEITSKGLGNFLSHPRKREREQRISPAPPLQSHWAVDLPFLAGKAVYSWVVRKNLESSVRGMSF